MCNVVAGQSIAECFKPLCVSLFDANSINFIFKILISFTCLTLRATAHSNRVQNEKRMHHDWLVFSPPSSINWDGSDKRLLVLRALMRVLFACDIDLSQMRHTIYPKLTMWQTVKLSTDHVDPVDNDSCQLVYQHPIFPSGSVCSLWDAFPNRVKRIRTHIERRQNSYCIRPLWHSFEI